MFFICVALLTLIPKFIENAGTTQNLREIFIGRCWHYQVLAKENKIDELKIKVNCTKLWDEFYASFAFKNPCDVSKDSYKKFFAMLDNPRKIKNALFWSGSNALVHQFTFINDQYIVLEETITGYLMNELIWCGSPSSLDGLNYTTCNSKDTSCNAMYPAWYIASQKFAERAAGVSHVLLNGSRSNNHPAYYKGSFFRTVEVPFLKVEKLVALVATTIGTQIREHCKSSSSSLRELEKDVAKLNITFECVDQPMLVLRIYCIKMPHAPECNHKQSLLGDPSHSSTELEDVRLWKISCFTLVAVVVSILLFVGMIVIRKHFFHKSFRLNYSISSSKPIVNDV